MKLLLQRSERWSQYYQKQAYGECFKVGKAIFDTPNICGKYLETDEMFLPGGFEAFLPVFGALLKLAPVPHLHPRPHVR